MSRFLISKEESIKNALEEAYWTQSHDEHPPKQDTTLISEPTYAATNIALGLEDHGNEANMVDTSQLQRIIQKSHIAQQGLKVEPRTRLSAG